MGVLDKFLNAMKMNDDEAFDDGYLDDDYGYDDDYEDEPPKKRLLDKYPDDDYEKPQPKAPAPQPEARPVKTARSRSTSAKSAGKISPIRSPRRGNGMEVCVIRPKSMEDAREITETLLEECTVVLNMEGLDFEVAQRIIDFSSGSCYAIHGNLQKISNFIFIITPPSVDISGDFQEILNGAFDVPSFGTRF